MIGLDREVKGRCDDLMTSALPARSLRTVGGCVSRRARWFNDFQHDHTRYEAMHERARSGLNIRKIADAPRRAREKKKKETEYRSARWTRYTTPL